jgi:hypothetical protein
VRLREQFWMNVFEAAVAEDRSLIFTFQPEGSALADFAPRVAGLVRRAGGGVLLVHLQLSADGQISRIANEDRARFANQRNADFWRGSNRSSKPASGRCRRISWSARNGFQRKLQLD